MNFISDSMGALGGTPAEIAKPFAERVGFRGEFGNSPDEEALLTSLDAVLDILGQEGTYFVEAGRALSIPYAFDKSLPVNIGSFDEGLSFEGPFRSYSIVQIGRFVGASSVRALCLTFSDAFLLPHFQTLEDDHLLHVPVLAIEHMDRTN